MLKNEDWLSLSSCDSQMHAVARRQRDAAGNLGRRLVFGHFEAKLWQDQTEESFHLDIGKVLSQAESRTGLERNGIVRMNRMIFVEPANRVCA